MVIQPKGVEGGRKSIQGRKVVRSGLGQLGGETKHSQARQRVYKVGLLPETPL